MTHTPWTTEGSEADDWSYPSCEDAAVSGGAPFYDANGTLMGFTVCVGWNEKDEERRQLIIKAVNSHDKLVEALRAVLGAVRDHLPPDGIDKDEFINRVIYAVDNPNFNEAAKGLDL